MKVISRTLGREHKEIQVHTFADLHLGDRLCDVQLINQRVKAVADNPNAFIILNGDIMNNATRNSVSDTYGEVMAPMDQINRFIELFTPISERILCINPGNHERRTYKSDGIDLSSIAAKEMGLDDCYSHTATFLFLRLGEESRGRKRAGRKGGIRQVRYTIYSVHGSGGGRREGGKANRLADLASIVDADIYIHSHTHLPMIMKQDFNRVSNMTDSVKPVTKLFVNTAATLDYGGYGELFQFKPSSKDTPVIHLSGTKKMMWAEL